MFSRCSRSIGVIVHKCDEKNVHDESVQAGVIVHKCDQSVQAGVVKRMCL